MAVSKTRAKLVDVARQLFAKNGVDNTTMNRHSGCFNERAPYAVYLFQKQGRNLYGGSGVRVGKAF